MSRRLAAAAAFLRPVAGDIAASVRVDLVTWLEGIAARWKRGAGRHVLTPATVTFLPAPAPPSPDWADVTAWDLIPFRVPRYMDRQEMAPARRAA